MVFPDEDKADRILAEAFDNGLSGVKLCYLFNFIL